MNKVSVVDAWRIGGLRSERSGEEECMAPPIIARGTCYALFAYEVAHAIDLAAAERRLESATQRQTVKQKRRAPAFFEYDPAPLRVTEPPASLATRGHVTGTDVEFALY